MCQYIKLAYEPNNHYSSSKFGIHYFRILSSFLFSTFGKVLPSLLRFSKFKVSMHMCNGTNQLVLPVLVEEESLEHRVQVHHPGREVLVLPPHRLVPSDRRHRELRHCRLCQVFHQALDLQALHRALLALVVLPGTVCMEEVFAVHKVVLEVCRVCQEYRVRQPFQVYRVCLALRVAQLARQHSSLHIHQPSAANPRHQHHHNWHDVQYDSYCRLRESFSALALRPKCL